jgi:hypothetical protein
MLSRLALGHNCCLGQDIIVIQLLATAFHIHAKDLRLDMDHAAGAPELSLICINDKILELE